MTSDSPPPRPPCRTLARLVATLVLLGSPAAAATYYVSPAGSDAAAGTAPRAAFATLQHAADLVLPGDVVVVLPGHHAGFHLTASGLPGQPITFRADPALGWPEPSTVVDGNNGVTSDRINLEGASHVVIEGLTVIGSGDPATNRAGIRAVGLPSAPARDVVVRRCRVDRGGRWGFFTGFVDDVLVEDCEMSRSADEHGIYLSNSGDRPVVRRCVLWGNRRAGLHVNGDASQGGDGVISAARIERNEVFDNGTGGGSGINCDGVRDSVIANNLLHGNHASGISLYRIDGGQPSSGNVVANNTVIVAADGRFALNLKDGSSGNAVRNNVLLNDHSFRGAIDATSDCLPGMSCDFNAVKNVFALDDVFVDLATWQALTGLDAQSFVAGKAGLFADPAGDFHLKPGAPAIDAGTPDFAPADDFDGQSRPAGRGFDVGADEAFACYGSVAVPGPGTPGSGGFVPLLGATGCPDLGAALVITLEDGRGGAPALLVLGGSAAPSPFAGGTLWPPPQIVVPLVLGGASGAAGQGSIALPVAVPSTPSLDGATPVLQFLIGDPAAVQGVALSNALQLALGSP